jgi:hypothetical protein
VYRRYASLFFLVGVDEEEVRNKGESAVTSAGALFFFHPGAQAHTQTSLTRSRLPPPPPPPPPHQNELATLELIHALVEALDRHFGSVCELDLMFHLDTAHWALDEFVSGGGVGDANKANALAALALLEKVPGG